MATLVDGRVRMTNLDKDIIEILAGEKIKPETREDLNAWVKEVTKPDPNDSPEEKLLKAVAEAIKIEGEEQESKFHRVRPEEGAPGGAKIISFRK